MFRVQGFWDLGFRDSGFRDFGVQGSGIRVLSLRSGPGIATSVLQKHIDMEMCEVSALGSAL